MGLKKQNIIILFIFHVEKAPISWNDLYLPSCCFIVSTLFSFHTMKVNRIQNNTGLHSLLLYRHT